jgi:hypothetical protein
MVRFLAFMRVWGQVMLTLDTRQAECYSRGVYHGTHAGFCISRAECQYTRPLDVSFGRCAEPLHRAVFSRIAVVGVLATVDVGVFCYGKAMYQVQGYQTC